jgi:hypothetical protein
MKQTQTSPWLPVTVGIAGLIAGYVFVLAQGGPDVFASQMRCKANQKCPHGGCVIQDNLPS